MEVTDSVQMDVTDSVQSDSKSRWGEKQNSSNNNNSSGFTLFSSKLQAAPVKQAENTGFGTFLGGGFKLGGSQKTTCECGPQCPTSLSSRAREFARAGFFYTGLEDAVKCFACGVGVHQWEDGDDIRSDHIRWSVNQNCPYMRKTFPEMF